MDPNVTELYVKDKASAFLKFDQMVTPGIIQIIYYIGIAIGVLMGFSMVLRGLSAYGSGAEVLMGLVFMLVIPLFVRVWCELTIVVFKIHEALQVIKNK